MADFKKMKPEEFERSVFQMIGRDWMLVAAEKNGKVNTMTASWGGIDVYKRQPLLLMSSPPVGMPNRDAA